MANKKRKVVQLAGEALCKALGPVHEFFEKYAMIAGRPHCSTSNFYKVLKLRDDIKMLVFGGEEGLARLRDAAAAVRERHLLFFMCLAVPSPVHF